MTVRWLAACMLANALVAQAQTSPLPQRDPTLPPASVGADLAGDGSTPAVALPLRVNGSNVVVREGKPFLVVGSRLVAPGQTVESYRLERITETEIWLRDASGITKVARFAGVQRQVASTQCVAKPSATPPSAKKPAKKALPAKRATAHPPPSKTGAAAPRPIRENNAHDC